MIRLPASLCLLGAVLMSACAASAEPQTAQPGAVGQSRKPVPVQQSEPTKAQAVTGEVPAEVIAKLREDLSIRHGVDAASARVVSAEAVTWPNGALGCAQPGEMYTQATVPGYRVVLEADGRRYAYHVAQRGHFTLCPPALK